MRRPSHDAPCPTRADRARGFTLFEVLAAALVLVLVGVLTIGSMNTNLAHLSDARVRLEAGRIADAALADLEATLWEGSAPPISSNDDEIGVFRVATRVTPFGVLFETGDAQATADGPPANLFAIIAEELPGLPKHLRVLHVRVAWGDVEQPEFVERTSVAFDHAAALEAFQERTGGQDAEEDDQ